MPSLNPFIFNYTPSEANANFLKNPVVEFVVMEESFPSLWKDLEFLEETEPTLCYSGWGVYYNDLIFNGYSCYGWSATININEKSKFGTPENPKQYLESYDATWNAKYSEKYSDACGNAGQSPNPDNECGPLNCNLTFTTGVAYYPSVALEIYNRKTDSYEPLAGEWNYYLSGGESRTFEMPYEEFYPGATEYISQTTYPCEGDSEVTYEPFPTTLNWRTKSKVTKDISDYLLAGVAVYRAAIASGHKYVDIASNTRIITAFETGELPENPSERSEVLSWICPSCELPKRYPVIALKVNITNPSREPGTFNLRDIRGAIGVKFGNLIEDIGFNSTVNLPSVLSIYDKNDPPCRIKSYTTII